MGGFIILEDGRAYAASNWAFRATVDSIADILDRQTSGKDLAEWLRDESSPVQIYNTIDVRELTPRNREMFLTAVEEAFRMEQSRGPGGFAEPEFRDGWFSRFADLVKMIGCVRRGEPPSECNPHMRDVIPPTGGRSGPGW